MNPSQYADEFETKRSSADFECLFAVNGDIPWWHFARFIYDGQSSSRATNNDVHSLHFQFISFRTYFDRFDGSIKEWPKLMHGLTKKNETPARSSLLQRTKECLPFSAIYSVHQKCADTLWLMGLTFDGLFTCRQYVHIFAAIDPIALNIDGEIRSNIERESRIRTWRNKKKKRKEKTLTTMAFGNECAQT